MVISELLWSEEARLVKESQIKRRLLISYMAGLVDHGIVLLRGGQPKVLQ